MCCVESRLVVLFAVWDAWCGCKQKVIQIEYASSQFATTCQIVNHKRPLKTYILVTCPYSMLSTSPVGEHFAAIMLLDLVPMSIGVGAHTTVYFKRQ